jgi:hypothetical protein
VELLLVVAILGIVAAVVLPNPTDQRHLFLQHSGAGHAGDHRILI